MTDISSFAVPCGSCRLCCQGRQLVPLHPELGDGPTTYETQEVENPINGAVVVAVTWKTNGECVYLGETGCSIYDRRPVICRAYDCRMQYLSHTRAQRDGMVAHGLADPQTFVEAKKRLHTLTGEQRLQAIAIRKQREAA